MSEQDIAGLIIRLNDTCRGWPSVAPILHEGAVALTQLQSENAALKSDITDYANASTELCAEVEGLKAELSRCGRDNCMGQEIDGVRSWVTKDAFDALQADKARLEEEVDFYEREFYPLSNFSAFTLMWFGHRFDTSEAAYHWMKFPPEHAPKTPEVYAERQRLLWAIMDAPSAHEAFKLAEHNAHLRRADWSDVKVDIMRGIIRAKAEQHEYVRRKLLETGDRLLVEGSWRDDFWGIGPNRDGQNMLGKLWMELRAALKDQSHD